MTGSPRIEVLLADPLRLQPEHVGKWHIFLPSDMLLRLACLTGNLEAEAAFDVPLQHRRLSEAVPRPSWSYLP